MEKSRINDTNRLITSNNFQNSAREFDSDRNSNNFTPRVISIIIYLFFISENN